MTQPVNLDAVPALRALPPDVRRLLAGAVRRQSYRFGQVVVRQDDDADAWFILEKGRARVLRLNDEGQEVPLAIMDAGAAFGEIALLEGGKRSATVRATEPLDVLRLDKTVFDALLGTHPELADHIRTLIQHRRLNDLLRGSAAFSALDTEDLRLLVRESTHRTLAPENVLFHQGDPADAIYVVQSGRLRVFIDVDGSPRNVAWLRKGDIVGERAVLSGGTRSAGVAAVSESSLLVLQANTVRTLQGRSESFATAIDQLERLYESRDAAAVPLDFADEILPAEAATAQVSEAALDTLDGSTLGPFASPEGWFVKKDTRIRRFPVVRQLDAMDCGAASLGMVCRHFGRKVSLTRIREVVGTGYDGTSLSGICDGARALGLAARSVKVSKEKVDHLPLPAICHIDGNHWVVFYDLDDKAARIADPGVGLRVLERADFMKRWSGYAALFDYTVDFDDAPESRPNVAWLWTFARPHLSTLAQATGLALVVSGLQMAMPVFTQLIVDRVLIEKDVALLHAIVGAMVGVMVVTTVASMLQRYLLSFVAVRIDTATFDFLTRRLLALPMPWFSSRRVGDIQRRLGGARQIRSFLVENGVVILRSIAQLAAALLFMALYDVTLTFVFLVMSPLYVLLMRWSKSSMRPLFNDLEEAYGKYASRQVDGIKGIEAVKTMGAEARLRERLLGEFTSMADTQFRADYTRMAFGASIQTVGMLAKVVFLLLTAHKVIEGEMTIGGLVAFTSLAAMANGPVLTLVRLYDQIQLIGVLVDRLADVFEAAPEQADTPIEERRPVPTLEGRLTLKNVGFRYGGPGSPMILSGVSVDIPPGTRVALVGRSGSGKTTLIKLLTGLLTPSEGRVLYDTVDMTTLDFRALRRRIGCVLQESYLFSDTIETNIAFGDPTPDRDKVVQAARAAAADDFIRRLPLGYTTRIGESGLRLSGGQAQRINIARALYGEPPVVIFDEATSALDAESERAVKENMDRFLAGRTSIVIAHRLSTIRDADLILVLEQGRLVEQGSHEALLEREGLYHHLISQQLGL